MRIRTTRAKSIPRASTGAPSIRNPSPITCASRPGPHNPLGQIKFEFANPYGVYLHGTPGELAFARGLRALSHGCVRVEDEISLAQFALAPDPAWTRERLLETLKSASEYRLPLPEPLPVYLLYFTASAQPDGAAQFGKDPYGWDRDLLAALGPDSARVAAAPSPQG